MALILLCVLVWMFQAQFHGVSPQSVTVYSRAGDGVTLPCDRLKHYGPTCSEVNWRHFKHYQAQSVTKVSKGSVVPSERSRLSLDSDCSLRLHKVTEDDAGAFHCELDGRADSSLSVHLNVLTVSEAEAEAEADADERITLQCSLGTYGPHCDSDRFRWLVQNQEVPSLRRTNCVSHLSVEPQTENTSVTCELMRGNEVKVSVEHSVKAKESVPAPTPGPREGSGAGGGSVTERGSGDGVGQSVFIIVGAVLSLLLLLVVAVVVLFKVKSKRNAPKSTVDAPEAPQSDAPVYDTVDSDGGLMYATVNYQKKSHQTNARKQQLEVEDSVTYSAVSIKTVPDNSAIYSTVNKT